MTIDRSTCAQAFRLLDDYVDRELDAQELERIRSHLEVCAVCAAEFRFEASVIRNVRSKVQRLAIPPGLEARVWQAITRERKRDSPPRAAAIDPVPPRDEEGDV